MTTHSHQSTIKDVPHVSQVSTPATTLTRKGATCGACGASEGVGANTPDPTPKTTHSDQAKRGSTIHMTATASQGSERHEMIAPRLAYNVEEAAAMLAVGRDSIYELIRTGQLTTFKIGTRRLVAMQDIEAFINAAKVSS